MELTPKVRDIRKSQGKTLQELADMVGVSVPHLSELERGKKNLNSRTLAKIAEALKVDPSELIAGAVPPVWADLLDDLNHLAPEDQDRVRAFAESLRQSKGGA